MIARGLRALPVTASIIVFQRLYPLVFDSDFSKNSRPPVWVAGYRVNNMLGGDLLSHVVSHAVPSTLKGLASGFGMGTGRFPFALTAVTLWTYDLRRMPIVFREPHSGRVAVSIKSVCSKLSAY